jgi:hypothetical protein
VDLAISRNAKVAALASLDFTMAWELHTNEIIYNTKEFLAGYLSINPQGTHLALGDRERTGVGIVDIKTGTNYSTIFEEGIPIVCRLVSARGLTRV